MFARFVSRKVMSLVVALSLSAAFQVSPLEAQEEATESAVPKEVSTPDESAKADSPPTGDAQVDAPDAIVKSAGGKIATQAGDDGGTVEVEVTPEQDKVIKGSSLHERNGAMYWSR